MKPFTTAAVIFFALVAALHLTRIVLSWKVIIGESVVTVGGTSIPMWVSYLGAIIPAALAVMVWRESRQGRIRTSESRRSSGPIDGEAGLP
jgi:hypothetical protein